MSTGLINKLTGQIGEHLVTAELGRRGIIATPFSGNVPEIDILAHNKGITGHIQVKAINKNSSWQFDIRTFLNIRLTKTRQQIDGKNINLDRTIICVFVALGDYLGDDKFYIFKLGWLQDWFKKSYEGRKLPKNINSFHCAIWEKDMRKHLDRWNIIARRFNV